MRSLTRLTVLLAAGVLAHPVLAQSAETAGGLAAPTARDGSRPAAPPPGLRDVPPPPTSGYSAPRYAAPSAQTRATRSDNPDVRIPSRTATRLRVLDGSLQALAARGGNNVLDGVLSLVSGGLSVGVAGWQWSEDRQLASYLLVWGGANVARGLIDLSLRPNASRAAIAFSHLPMGTLAEVEARLAFGEDALRELARRTRLGRVLDASLNIAVGAAVIPLYLAPNDFELEDPFDYFVIIGSGISIISGLIGLVSRSDAERRWSAYQDLRDRLVAEEAVAEEPTSGLRFEGIGGGPTRGGAALSSRWSF
ncbi:MAG: hypothetical protein AAGE52_17800 [Myxococcota bacterium]